jgi:hypothetical protein
MSGGQHTRCSLVSFETLARASYSEAVAGNFEPSLAIDFDQDAVKVTNSKTNALVGSAPLAHVTATAANREYRYGLGRVMMPILVVSVPDSPPLTVGCIEVMQRFGPTLRSMLAKNAAYRFSWLDTVPVTKKDPAYFVSGADWLTLVEKFGLAPQLEDSEPPSAQTASPPGPSPLYTQPRYTRVMRRIMVSWLGVCAAFFVVLIVLYFIVH